MYTIHVFGSRLGWIQSQAMTFYEFIWAFRDRRYKDCLSIAWDVLFQRLLPGTMGVPLSKMRDQIKRMITILEGEMPASKDTWPGHASIPQRVFGPSQYLVMLPVQPTRSKPKPKPMVTLKPLLSGTPAKLVPPGTQNDAEEWQCRQVITGGEARRTERTGTLPVSNFVHWFEAISTNMNPEVQ